MGDCSNERVFVLAIDDVPVLAFQARSMSEALELGREAWLREDLKRLTSDRAPLWDGRTQIRTRSARPNETARYWQCVGNAASSGSELPLVFLVAVDDHLEVAEAASSGAFPPLR